MIIIDDSAVARAAYSHALAGHDYYAVVGAFDRAERAIEWLGRHPVDIILLDLNLPGRSGLSALPDLLRVSRGARILVVSASTVDGAPDALQALAHGAADTFAKPVAGSLGQRFGDALIERMAALGVTKGARPPTDACRQHIPPGPAPSAKPLACLGIGASTGGLFALSKFFAALPPAFDAPIFVTQHLPSEFMPIFAGQLAAASGRPVEVAVDGAPVLDGWIHVAPGTRHLGCRTIGGVVRTILTDAPAPSRSLPSVDPMLESLAALYGDATMAVVLSGMGQDGLLGAGYVRAAGGDVIVQDSASSAVWGMPGAIARAGLASVIAGPADLARHIAACGSRS